MLRDIIETFRKPSATTLAYRELEEAQRNLLECQKQRDYYAKLSEFSEIRITRLKRMLAQETESEPQA